MFDFKKIIIKKAYNELNCKNYKVCYENDYDGDLYYSDLMTLDDAIKFADDYKDHIIFIYEFKTHDDLKKLSSELHMIVGDNNG